MQKRLPDVIVSQREPALSLWRNIKELLKNSTPQAVARFALGFHFSISNHTDVLRKSGESYYRHDCRVATRLSCYFDDNLDLITAALVHEAIEDDGVTEEALKSDFGENITSIVVAVSKLPKENFSEEMGGRRARLEDHVDRMREECRKDWRIIVLKIVDRLENTSDTAGLSDEDKQRMFLETEADFLPLFRFGASRVPIDHQKVVSLWIQEIEFNCDNYFRSQVLP